MKLTLIHSFTIALATATAQSLDCGVKVDAKTGILDPSTRNPACLEPIVFGALGTDQSKPGAPCVRNRDCPDGRIVLGPISYGVPYLCRDKKCTECTPDGGYNCEYRGIQCCDPKGRCINNQCQVD